MSDYRKLNAELDAALARADRLEKALANLMKFATDCDLLIDGECGIGRYEEASEIVAARAALGAPAEPATEEQPCGRCDGRGEVPATPGQPGDGPMPCPDCAPEPEPWDADECRCASGMHTCGRPNDESAASSMSAGAGQTFVCPNCHEDQFPDVVGTVKCSECGAKIETTDAGAGQVPADTIEKALKALRRTESGSDRLCPVCRAPDYSPHGVHHRSDCIVGQALAALAAVDAQETKT